MDARRLNLRKEAPQTLHIWSCIERVWLILTPRYFTEVWKGILLCQQPLPLFCQCSTWAHNAMLSKLQLISRGRALTQNTGQDWQSVFVKWQAMSTCAVLRWLGSIRINNWDRFLRDSDAKITPAGFYITRKNKTKQNKNQPTNQTNKQKTLVLETKPIKTNKTKYSLHAKSAPTITRQYYNRNKHDPWVCSAKMGVFSIWVRAQYSESFPH